MRVYGVKCPALCKVGEMATGGLTEMGPVPSPEGPANTWPPCDSMG